MMNLVRWNPTRDLLRMNDRWDRMLDGFFDSRSNSGIVASPWDWNPAVDVYDNDDAIVIKAEIPGVDRKNLSVDLKGRVLTLKGERSDDNEVKEDSFYRRECRYGRFQRAFTLPADVDADQVNASFKDGVLTIEIPKPKETKPAQITVH